MSMIKRVTLTINKNNTSVKLSSPLNFFKNDSLTLYFEIEKYNFELREYARVVPISAIAYVETPDNRDTIQATIVEGNLIMFNLTPYHTNYVGVSRMQLVIRDNDGCQCATPAFTFDISELINDYKILVDEDGNIFTSEEDIPLTLEGANGYNSISDLEEATSLADAYMLITQNEKSYKAKTSLLTGDIGEMLGYAKVEDVPTSTSQLINDSDYVTNPDLESKGYITEHQDISHLATKTELESKANSTHTHAMADIVDLKLPTSDIDKNYVDDALLGKADIAHIHSYNDLVDKPVIPIIPTKLSELDNDTNFISTIPSEYVTETELDDRSYATQSYVDTAIKNAQMGGGSEGDIDLSNYVTKEELNTKANIDHTHGEYLTSVPDIYATKADLVHSHDDMYAKTNHAHEEYLTEHQDISQLATKMELQTKANAIHTHSYNDLSDKPTIPSVEGLATEKYVDDAIANAQLSGGETEVDLTKYALKTELPTKTSQLTNDSGYLTSVPTEYITESELEAKGFLTEHQDISGLALKTELHSHSNKTILDGITSTDIDTWNSKSEFDGDYNSLTNKPNIPTVDVDKAYVDKQLAFKSDRTHTHDEYLTSVPSEYVTESELDAKGYLTQHQDLSSYATKGELNSYALKTELHTHDNKVALDKITTDKITSWDNKSTFSGSYNDLTNKPTIPTIPSSLPANGGNADTVGGYTVWVGTQAQYDAMATKSNTTIYYIKG